MTKQSFVRVAVATVAAALIAVGCGDDDDDKAATGVDAAAQKDTAAAADTSSGVGTGPGAALKCTSSGKNAWDTFGVNAFVAVNEAIFANVTTEVTANGTTNLGDSFTKVGSGNPPSTADDAATFKGKLAAFLVYAYGGPAEITYTDNKKYTGPQDMVSAHLGLNITSAQYDYFIANVVVPALTKSGVSTADVSSCFAPIVTNATFKASIVGH